MNEDSIKSFPEAVIDFSNKAQATSGADDQGHATPILSLSHGIFTD